MICYNPNVLFIFSNNLLILNTLFTFLMDKCENIMSLSCEDNWWIIGTLDIFGIIIYEPQMVRQRSLELVGQCILKLKINKYEQKNTGDIVKEHKPHNLPILSETRKHFKPKRYFHLKIKIREVDEKNKQILKNS